MADPVGSYSSPCPQFGEIIEIPPLPDPKPPSHETIYELITVKVEVKVERDGIRAI
jgi:hypothetical protein